MLKNKKLEIWLIILCGLPAVGKSTLARKLLQALPDYVLVDQNRIRREMGYRHMPKNKARSHDKVLRQTDRIILENLLRGCGVIFDSVNRFSFRRLQLYGIASGCGVKGLTLEVVCPEKVAKNRMKERKTSDGLISDPKYTRVYDCLKKEWESVSVDHVNFGSDHVSHLQYDSHTNQTKRVMAQKGSLSFLGKIERVLKTKDA